MTIILPSLYLTILFITLLIVASFLIKQIIQKRETETEFSSLQKKLKQGEMTYQDHYSLGVIYLSKKLFDQSIIQFSYALKSWDNSVSSDSELANLYNTIGFTYFETNQLDFAIYYYKKAIEVMPNYITAIKNLGYAYERKKLIPEAIEIYKTVLQYDQDNNLANEKVISLSKKIRISG
jgi:tetratricopeptide (TPR) repeat protein